MIHGLGRYLIIAISVLILLFIPRLVLAVELSEIGYSFIGSDTDREWLELVNTAPEAVDLTGYLLFDGSYHLINLPPVNGGQGKPIIEPGEYLILAANATTFLAEHPNYQGTVLDTVMALPDYNSQRTEPIILRLTNKAKETVAEVAYLPRIGGDDGYTLELKSTGEWQDSALPGGSPGQENGPPLPNHYPDTIRLSEIMANPAGSDSDNEWIEIENTGDGTVDLGRWYVTDRPTSSGTIHRQSFPVGLVIEPHSFAILSLKGSFLNNSDEQVSLYQPDGQSVEVVDLNQALTEGWSLSLVDGTWQPTNQVTPGQSNFGALAQSSNDPTPASSNGSVGKPIAIGSPSATTQPGVKISPPVLSASSLPKSSKPKVSPTPKKMTAKPKPKKSPKTSPKSKASRLSPRLPNQLTLVAGVSRRKTAAPWQAWLLMSILGLLVGGALLYSHREKLQSMAKIIREHWPPDIMK